VKNRGSWDLGKGKRQAVRRRTLLHFFKQADGFQLNGYVLTKRVWGFLTYADGDVRIVVTRARRAAEIGLERRYGEIPDGAKVEAIRTFRVTIIVPLHIAIIVRAIIGDSEKCVSFDEKTLVVIAFRALDVFKAIAVSHGESPFSVGG
jgi:hypothetical protein